MIANFFVFLTTFKTGEVNSPTKLTASDDIRKNWKALTEEDVFTYIYNTQSDTWIGLKDAMGSTKNRAGLALLKSTVNRSKQSFMMLAIPGVDSSKNETHAKQTVRDVSSGFCRFIVSKADLGAP